MGCFAESLEKEGAGPVGGPIRRLWKNLGKRCCDPAQMVSGERKRDGGFGHDLEVGSGGPVVNCVQGGKESGESRKVLDV